LDINISADNYIGIIDIPNTQTSSRIYVEVFSKLIPRGLGYPELLMDNKTRNNRNLTSYSGPDTKKMKSYTISASTYIQ